MTWLIPTILFVMAFASWRWSFRAEECLVRWCRFILAVFLLILAAIYGVVGAVQWVVA